MFLQLFTKLASYIGRNVSLLLERTDEVRRASGDCDLLTSFAKPFVFRVHKVRESDRGAGSVWSDARRGSRVLPGGAAAALCGSDWQKGVGERGRVHGQVQQGEELVVMRRC
jgi:hypothetical protein